MRNLECAPFEIKRDTHKETKNNTDIFTRKRIILSQQVSRLSEPASKTYEPSRGLTRRTNVTILPLHDSENIHECSNVAFPWCWLCAPRCKRQGMRAFNGTFYQLVQAYGSLSSMGHERRSPKVIDYPISKQ